VLIYNTVSCPVCNYTALLASVSVLLCLWEHSTLCVGEAELGYYSQCFSFFFCTNYSHGTWL